MASSVFWVAVTDGFSSLANVMERLETREIWVRVYVVKYVYPAASGPSGSRRLLGFMYKTNRLVPSQQSAAKPCGVLLLKQGKSEMWVGCGGRTCGWPQTLYASSPVAVVYWGRPLEIRSKCI